MEPKQKEMIELSDFLQNQQILSKNILSLEEASVYLQLSKSTIYKLTSQKKIAYHNPGGKKLYFRKEDLDTWMLQNRVAPIHEYQNQADNYVSRTNKI